MKVITQNNILPALARRGRPLLMQDSLPCDASVVVPTHNRVAKLARLLKSLDRLQVPPREVIVVADRCVDTTPQSLDQWQRQDHRFEPEVLKLEAAGGPGRTRNAGLLCARGDVVAFTDDDCIVGQGWLSHLTEKLDPDTGVVGVGGKVLSVRNDLISRYNTYWRILEPPASLDYLTSANCCYIRREAMEVGGFDERIEKPGGEDVSLSFKLRRKGWKFQFANEATVYHDYRSSLVDFIQTFVNYGGGCHMAAAEHLPESPGIQQISSGVQTLARGGYGYFGIQHTVPRNPWSDILLDLTTIAQASLTRSDKVSFAILKLLQRFGYHYGWNRGGWA